MRKALKKCCWHRRKRRSILYNLKQWNCCRRCKSIGGRRSQSDVFRQETRARLDLVRQRIEAIDRVEKSTHRIVLNKLIEANHLRKQSKRLTKRLVSVLLLLQPSVHSLTVPSAPRNLSGTINGNYKPQIRVLIILYRQGTIRQTLMFIDLA